MSDSVKGCGVDRARGAALGANVERPGGLAASINSYTIRPAKAADLPDMLRIYGRAREFMVAQGNPNQWSGGYPGRELLEADMAAGESFVIVGGDGAVHATFMYHRRPDPTYAVIDGAWPNDEAYGTIHRIASDGTVRGVVAKAVEFALQRCPQVRADTHADNTVMQRALLKAGFVRCGIIRIADGSPRIAYQRCG